MLESLGEKGQQDARNTAIALLHLDGFSSYTIANHFGITRRWTNCIISKECTVVLKEAFRLYKEAKEQDERKQIESTFIVSASVMLNYLEDKTAPARTASQISRLKREIKSLKLTNAKLRSVNDQLKSREPDVACLDPRVHMANIPTLISEMVNQATRNKYARSYSDQMYRFSYVLMSMSPRAYKVARTLLPLPARSCVFNKYQAVTKTLQGALTDLKETHKLIEIFIDSNLLKCEGERITCTLGVDAFAFRLFLRQLASITNIRKKLSQNQLRQLGPLLEDRRLIEAVEEISSDEFDDDYDDFDESSPVTEEEMNDLFASYNSCFLYVLMPLNSNIPCFPLHLAPASHGMAQQEQVDVLNQLTSICQTYNIDVRYMSVDGDRGWHDKFADMMDVIQSKPRKGSMIQWALDVYGECFEKGVQLAVTDLLHAVKCARGRYIDHGISVISTCSTANTNYEAVRNLLDLGMALYDKSQLGRMRDCYPLEMFTPGNVTKLLKHKYFPDAVYFAPFTLLLVCIRVPFLRMDFRLKLLNLSFLLFSEMSQDLNRRQSVPREENSPKVAQRGGKNTDMVTYAERYAFDRLLCTIISYCCAFQMSSEMLRTDALGTHIVEQMIGQGRHARDSRWQKILATFTQSVLRTTFLATDGVDVSNRGRLKTAGTRLVEDGDVAFEDFDEVEAAQVFIHSLSPDARAASDFDGKLKTVIKLFVKLEDVIQERGSEIGRVWPPNPIANSSIMARLLKSSLKDFTVVKEAQQAK